MVKNRYFWLIALEILNIFRTPPKNMGPLAFDPSTIPLQLKNKAKFYRSSHTHEKGPEARQVLLYEPFTLDLIEIINLLLQNFIVISFKHLSSILS